MGKVEDALEIIKGMTLLELRDLNKAIEDEFGISDSAVKKQARSYKSVIKLDRNFHIYVHGNRNLLEQGEDEKGKFYKVYYEEEE